MSTKHLILGWIRTFPSHGYMIKKCFEMFINPDKKLNDAKLYPLLREMEEEGLIKRETEDQEVGPSRKVIRITKAGEEEFLRWLESDSGEVFPKRPRYDFFRAMPFLVKFPFFYELDDNTIMKKIEDQVAIHQAKLDDFKSAKEKMIEKDLQQSKVQVLDFGIMLEETIIEWLEKVAKDYGRGKRTKREG